MQTTPLPPSSTVHQTLTDAMFAKTIFRRCDGLYEPTGHDFAECERHQIDAAMQADKKADGYRLRSEAAALKMQIDWSAA